MNSLIYVCHDEDDKALLRHKVFDRWYKKSEHRESIMKIDNIIQFNVGEISASKIYTSFIFHKSNPDYNKLIEIYRSIEKILNQEK